MKYLSIFYRNVVTIFHLQWKIGNISDMFLQYSVLSQVGFAEFNNTADNRTNIGGTIIGAPIVGQ